MVAKNRGQIYLNHKNGHQIFCDITSLMHEHRYEGTKSLNLLTVWSLENSAITTQLEAPNSYLFVVLGDTSARSRVWRGKIVVMNNNKYPRLCIRLSPTMKRRITISARTRHISQARVVRDALTNFFVGSELIDEEF